jgi:hypothetical protein
MNARRGALAVAATCRECLRLRAFLSAEVDRECIAWICSLNQKGTRANRLIGVRHLDHYMKGDSLKPLPPSALLADYASRVEPREAVDYGSGLRVMRSVPDEFRRLAESEL